MAEEDTSQKTEDPTQKRLDDARKKGQVVNSKEVSTFFTLFAATAVVIMFAPWVAEGVRQAVLVYVERPHTIDADGGNLRRVLSDTLFDVASLLALPVLFLLVAGVTGNVVVSGFVVAGERIQIKWSKLNVINGLKQMFSLKSFVEFGKSLLKIVLVGGILFWLIWPEMRMVMLFTDMAAITVLSEIHERMVVMMIAVAGLMAVVAGMDYAYQRYEFMKQMRMSKQDVKDEHKQQEGDPMVKAKIRQLRTERAQQRMMQDVPEADVVITNPTHFAVALKYDMKEMAAPMCIAKGQDNIALKIREVAEENDVVVVENPPVARALYATVEIDQVIPPEHYQAVAEIISYVYKLRNKKFN